MKEEELSTPIQDWLMNYKGCIAHFGEVQDIDIVGLLPSGATIAVELKKSFSMKLLQQAWDRTKKCQYTYIAVPKNLYSSPNRDFIEAFCKEKGIGILYIHLEEYYPESNYVKEILKPKFSHLPLSYIKYSHTAYVDIIQNHLNSYTRSRAGGRAGDREQLTDFKLAVYKVKFYIHNHPESTLQEIARHCDLTGYNNVESEVYTILNNYPEIVSFYKSHKGRRAVYSYHHEEDWDNIEKLIEESGDTFWIRLIKQAKE